MTPADRKSFVETVLGFAELKGKQLSAPALELYWRAMQHWSLGDFRAAAERLLLTSEFMPTPKHFEDLRRAGEVTAGEAWALVLEHCKGAYRSGEGIDDGGPIDQAAQALGGYRALAFHDVDSLHFQERRFAEHLAELRDVISTRVAVPQIASQRQSTGGLTHVGRIPQQLPRDLEATEPGRVTGASVEMDRQDSRAVLPSGPSG